ncbi:hypothetical protein AQUCO_04200047v1 [Aquilegia coerulea]|uniref:Potassium transporter n=1 Tax=Aquilegia coerulea TaxID=218851 RepID=A0A2G5CP58_AQUCA|nr:hypothetical protein AQUCO_04200047v1 [Aquilegia coerulea]
MALEAASCQSHESRWTVYATTLSLAYQSFGVVFGDLSISPIYVYSSTFSGRLRLHEDDAEILGVLSMIFWTLTLIPFCKYVIFVMGADDNGEGGTFALYSLLCRRSNMGLLNNSLAAEEHISVSKSKNILKETRTNLFIKYFFQKYRSSRFVLLLVVLLGTSMVIGDGVLTPTMSVLSAVNGLKAKVPHLHEMGLFAIQHYGTHRIGCLFAPISICWLLCIGGIGIYNLMIWNPRFIRALSPSYAYNFLRTAGAEAMFADLGHFSLLSIRIAFAGVVYPCIVLAYMGQAAYLSQNKEDLQRSFYNAIPKPIFWPVFIIATLATIVGSQAIISATFSIISQCRTLRCFPRVKIIHTSNQVHGQIYIPEVNWILMALCLTVVIGLGDTEVIGNAYGLAVITVMFVTTCLMFLVIVTVWNRTVLTAGIFVLVFGTLELLYVSACLSKVHRGGWLPLSVASIIVSVMCIWFYGTLRKDAFELQNKVSLDALLQLGTRLGIVRVPGIGLIYTNIISGVPPMFAHLVTNFPAFHKILIFVSLHPTMIPKIPVSERFFVSRVGPPEFCLFKCIVRYGYKDARQDSYTFENQLVEKVAEFLQNEIYDCSRSMDSGGQIGLSRHQLMAAKESGVNEETAVSVDVVRNQRFSGATVIGEVEELMAAKESGVTYMMGHTFVVAHSSSPFFKKFVINTVYSFLRRNSRHPAVTLGIPQSSLVEIGMVYHV